MNTKLTIGVVLVACVWFASLIKAQPPITQSATGGTLKQTGAGDAAADAAGRGQLFESIHVPGITDFREGTNGAAFADLNGDGWIDVVTISTPPFSLNTEGDSVRDRLRILTSNSNLTFHSQTVTIRGSDATPDDFGQGWRGSQIPSFADFNNDGLLDLFVTRQSPSRHGKVRPGFRAVGCSLLIADGTFHQFNDESVRREALNPLAYNRQVSLGDVNQDGFIDIAIGADNPTSGFEGIPKSALFIYESPDGTWESGHYTDIADSKLAPDFGGFRNDHRYDRAGPNLALRDIDNDSNLDLLQSTHVLARGLYPARRLPLSPIRYRQGVFTWKNLLKETGTFRLEKSVNNGLASEASLQWNESKRMYESTGGVLSPGLAYLFTADVDNDGLPDVLCVDGTDRTFTPKTENIAGRLWHNEGDFRFTVATEEAGLDSLNDTYESWYRFFDARPHPFLLQKQELRKWRVNEPGMQPMRPIDLRPYHGDVIFADFDNDTWIDFVLLDRRESKLLRTRPVLYRNLGDRKFQPQATRMSGLDASGLSGEAVDFNNDGLVDLYISGDPDNSAIEGRKDELARYEDKIYLNTGLHGASQNHWLRIRFAGITHARLLGARVEVFASETGKRLGSRGVYSHQTYRTGSPLECHFGLADHQRVDVVVSLTSGDRLRFEDVGANQYVELNLNNRQRRRFPVATQ